MRAGEDKAAQRLGGRLGKSPFVAVAAIVAIVAALVPTAAAQERAISL